MTRFALLPLAMFCLIFSSTSVADVAVYYDFAGGSAAQTSGIMTGSDIGPGGWLDQFDMSPANHGISGSSEVIFARTEGTGATTASGSTLAEAILDESYYGFTLTNSTAMDYQLDSLDFNYWFTSGFGGGDFRVYGMSSLAGFTDGNEHGFGQVLDNSRPTSGDQVLESLDISSLGILSAGSSVEFRLYFVDNSTSQSRIHRVDDVTVNVSQAIPEPASAALLGIGAIGLIARRRR